MSKFNPYQPPKTVEALRDPNLEGIAHLATRGQRFGAAIVDGLIGLALAVPVMWALGTFEYIKEGRELPGHVVFLGVVIGFALFSAVHFTTLSKYGQTIGKRLLKIRIATMEGEQPHVGHILLVRYLPVSVVQAIPGVGSLLSIVDVLFIFRRDRRCVHDLIAGTQVVRCD